MTHCFLRAVLMNKFRNREKRYSFALFLSCMIYNTDLKRNAYLGTELELDYIKLRIVSLLIIHSDKFLHSNSSRYLAFGLLIDFRDISVRLI